MSIKATRHLKRYVLVKETLRLGIAGLGTVGVGVIKIIEQNAALLSARCGRDITITAVSAKSKGKDRGVALDSYTWHDDTVALADDPNVDVVVELIGGDSGVAYDLVKKALTNGKHVVTANKALIAHHGIEFDALAHAHNVQLAFEAAVAGGIPILKALREGLVANRIESLSGIMNGTCNYILTEMKTTQRDFAPILADAQALGYAEADPSFDVDGVDTAHKLAILASMAFGMPVAFDTIYIEGIRNIALKDIHYAEELGYKIKLLGICKHTDQGVEQRVHPALVPVNYPIAKVDGVNNAVYAKGDFVGDVVLEGPGAGEGATASSVVADIADIAASRVFYPFSIPQSAQQKPPFVAMDSISCEYYLRIGVTDQAGVMAKISDALSAEDISIESLLQKPVGGDDQVDIIVITHKANESALHKACERIAAIEAVKHKPQMIRIER